jgi:transcriptional regulator with XRE-family HTH domain
MPQGKYVMEGIILLQEWMKEHKLSKASFAKKAKIEYRTIWRYFQRNHLPSLESAIKIEKITKGFVPCVSWESLKRLQKPRKRAAAKDQSNDGT